MFFEDEKNTSGDNSEMWEDVLDNGDDDLISLADDDIPQNVPQQPQVNPPSLDDSDDLLLVDDFNDDDDDDDVDDSELHKILSQDSEPSSRQGAFDAFGTNDAEQEPEQEYYEEQYEEDEEPDLDDQLTNVVLNKGVNDSASDAFMPRKEEKKSSSGLGPVIIAALVTLFVVMACLFVFKNFFNNRNITQGDLIPNTKQEEMNNISREEIEQRNQNINGDESIPVVNEEEIDGIKPDDEKDDSKKQVVNVKSGGRLNPFLPSAKYIAVSLPQTNIDFENTSIPKPPEVYGVEDEVTTKLMTILVSGIMYDEVKPSAIITLDGNDYFVQKGDKLDDYRVVEIGRNHVSIALGKNVYRANIGEEFKINAISGSAEFIPKKQGGGKQYYSVTEQQEGDVNSSSSRSGRYVSERDVTINAR